MVQVIGSNIVSPLGLTVEDNLQAVLAGRSRLSLYHGLWGLKEPFVASLFCEEQRKELRLDGHTMFESLAIQSIRRAIHGLNIDISSSHTCLIISTTKGNIELLEQDPNTTAVSELSPATAAQTIAKAIGITTRPIVVCNACISGINAQILANRLLEDGVYDNAIVCGAECLGPFIVSGFQSLKTISTKPCRPFDIERNGMNLGECAATIIFSSKDTKGNWLMVGGAIRNDAVHITNPSPKGEGCLKAINAIIAEDDKQYLATINVHATATMFNDQMESLAIERAGLSEVPIFGLKGYLGHTMGANGITETILTMAALDRGIIPATRGFEETGVSGKVSISGATRLAGGHDFLKIISGFGGNNAAVRYIASPQPSPIEREAIGHIEYMKTVEITPDLVTVEGQKIEHKETGSALLTELYHQYSGDYPKFFKMDSLSRLAFVASEMLLNSRDMAIDSIILFNHSSSIVSDREHARLVLKDKDHLASPSVFVYTLPNIAAGEIAIRQQCHGETAFYILPDNDEELMGQIIRASLQDKDNNTILTGWVDYVDEETFNAKLKIVHKL